MSEYETPLAHGATAVTQVAVPSLSSSFSGVAAALFSFAQPGISTVVSQPLPPEPTAAPVEAAPVIAEYTAALDEVAPARQQDPQVGLALLQEISFLDE